MTTEAQNFVAAMACLCANLMYLSWFCKWEHRLRESLTQSFWSCVVWDRNVILTRVELTVWSLLLAQNGACRTKPARIWTCILSKPWLWGRCVRWLAICLLLFPRSLDSLDSKHLCNVGMDWLCDLVQRLLHFKTVPLCFNRECDWCKLFDS